MPSFREPIIQPRDTWNRLAIHGQYGTRCDAAAAAKSPLRRNSGRGDTCVRDTLCCTPVYGNPLRNGRSRRSSRGNEKLPIVNATKGFINGYTGESCTALRNHSRQKGVRAVDNCATMLNETMKYRVIGKAERSCRCCRHHLFSVGTTRREFP